MDSLRLDSQLEISISCSFVDANCFRGIISPPWTNLIINFNHNHLIQLSMEILFEVQRRSRFHTCAPLFVELFFSICLMRLDSSHDCWKWWVRLKLKMIVTRNRFWPQVLNGRELWYFARVLWSTFRRPYPRIRVEPKKPLDNIVFSWRFSEHLWLSQPSPGKTFYQNLCDSMSSDQDLGS